MSYKVDVNFNNFSMGLNNRDANSVLQNSESPDMRDMILGKRGVLETRPGVVKYRTDRVAGTGDPATSLYEYITSGGTYVLAAAGTFLKKAIVGGWSTLKDNFTSGKDFSFITHGITGDCLMVNGADGYFRTDGATLAEVTPYFPTYDEAIEIGYNALGGYTSYAELTTALSGENNDIRYVAKEAGPGGAVVTIRYLHPGANSQPISVSVSVKAVTVNLATDATGNVISTANHVVNAIIGNSAAHALVNVQVKSGETGTGVVPPMGATNLIGGGNYTKTITDPKLIVYHNNLVWLANLAAFPDRVYFCGHDINGNILYNYFPTTNWIRSSNPRGEGVTAIVSFKGRLYIFTQSTIKVLTGVVPGDFVFSDVNRTVGAVSGRSVVTAGGYLFFLGPDGVYVFDGESAPKKISQRIPQTVKSISRVHRHRAVGMAIHERFYLSIPESTVNDVTLEYDTDVVVPDYIGEKHGFATSPWTLHRGFAANDWLMTKEENIYFAASDGYVYQYGVGYEGVGDAYLTTKGIDLGMPSHLKFFREIFLDFDYDFSSGFMAVEYKADNGEWKRLVEIDLSNRNRNMFWLGVRCRRVAFKFKNLYSGSRFRMFGFTLDVAVRGRQQKAVKD